MSDTVHSRNRRASAVGGVLHNLLAQRGIAERLRDYRAWQIWNEVVGPQIAARAQPCRIRDGILEIRVDQAVWMQQLQLLKPQIIARLNERLGGPRFRDLYLRRGRPDPPPASPPAPAPELPPLPDAERERIDSLVADLEDPELRVRLREVLQRQARLNLVKEDPASP